LIKKRPLPKSKKLPKSFAGWLLFILLSVIWGSSFILMKAGMKTLSAYQVATLRILSAAIVLLPFAAKAIKNIQRNKISYIIFSGLFGSFFPAYLYCIAETRIDSSLAAILNSLTPIFTIIVGVSFFKFKASPKKIIGVIIGFIGLVLLLFATKEKIYFNDILYSLLVVIATVSYALNVNIVSHYLHNTSSLQIASLAFSFLLIPALLILIVTGYFDLPLLNTANFTSTLAAVTLGIIGTAIASVLFYMLVKKEGPLFSSLVTYGIPVIAVVWGFIYGERITFAEIGCLAIILCGVCIVNMSK
jgi:drug/metabolite transporter (DMT)-like permease